MANNNSETKVVTGKVRFSYVHIFSPTSMGETDRPNYNITIIIPKSDKKTLAAIGTAIDAAKRAGIQSKFGGKLPANLKEPLHDGDVESPQDEAFADSYFVRAKSYTRPGVINIAGQAILNEEEVYSGCYGRISLNFYAYDKAGNKGIAAGLNNVMKLEDGEYLGGRSSAESDFNGYIEAEHDADDLL